MAININKLGQNTPITQNLNQHQVKQNNAQSNVALNQVKTTSQDSVSITPQAKQLAELQKKASDSSPINQKKIDELKKAISSGEYKVDPEKLAASFAKFEFAIDY